MRCRWFALCDRTADGLRAHPVLGEVPICERCAERVGEPLTQAERSAIGPAPYDLGENRDRWLDFPR